MLENFIVMGGRALYRAIVRFGFFVIGVLVLIARSPGLARHADALLSIWGIIIVSTVCFVLLRSRPPRGDRQSRSDFFRLPDLFDWLAFIVGLGIGTIEIFRPEASVNADDPFLAMFFATAFGFFIWTFLLGVLAAIGLFILVHEELNYYHD